MKKVFLCNNYALRYLTFIFHFVIILIPEQVNDVLETGSCDQPSLHSLHRDLLILSDNINDTVMDVNQKEDLKADVTHLREKLRKYQKKLKKAAVSKVRRSYYW